MNFDKLGDPWRKDNESASSSQRLERHVATARTVERFTAQVFRRDVVESIACLVVIYCFGSYLLDRELLARFAMPAVAAAGNVIVILGAIYVMYRLHRTRLSTPATRLEAPVREFLDNEIVRTEKQIVLLKSVYLWYLGPFYLGVLLIFFSVEGLCAEFFVAAAVVTVLFAFIDALNRFVATTSMSDLRNQLVRLRDSLASDAAPIVEPPESPDHSKAARRFALRWFIACLGVGLGGFAVAWWFDVEYAKRSPFDAVRWRVATPEVRINDEWFRLVSIDGVAAEEILAFCKRNYFAKWRKRFEEDLVEVLTRMGHAPGETVRLVVSLPGSSDEIVRDAVSMSEEKRWAIKRAAAARE